MNPSSYNNTAILIFANSPEVESKRKSFYKGRSLFRDLISKTIAEVKKTGLPFFHIDERHQRGQVFGERFINSIQDVFDLGYQYIIAIGADTPQLSSQNISLAAEEMYKGQIVIGPSTDGGFYLIGLHKSQFLPKELNKLPWQRSRLRDRLIGMLRHKGLFVSTLEAYMDLDKPSDLERLSHVLYNIPYSIKNYLQLIVQRSKMTEIAVEKYFEAGIIPFVYNKGSPKSFPLVSQ